MHDRRTVEIDEIRIVLESGDAASAQRIAADVERSLRASSLDITTSSGRQAIAIPGGSGQSGLGARIVRTIEERLR